MLHFFIVHVKQESIISDTYKFLDSRFRGNDNFLQIHHKSLINPGAIVLVTENNSRIEQAFPSAGATFP